MLRYRIARLLAALAGPLLLLQLVIGHTHSLSAESQPTEPQSPQTILPLLNQVGGSVWGLAQSGNLLYFGMGPRLFIANVSNPANPVELWRSEPLDGIPYELVIDGSVLYVISEGQLDLFDISTPTLPQHVGQYIPPGFAMRLVIKGGYAFVAERQIWDNAQWLYGGVRVVDISDPTNPTEQANFDIGDNASDLVIVGDLAYVVKGSGTVGDHRPGYQQSTLAAADSLFRQWG